MPQTAETLIQRYLIHGSIAHYALLLTPAEQRRRAAAVLAFHAQMRALCAITRDVAPAKIHWWHEEIERLRAKQPRHPITEALTEYADDGLIENLNALLHGAVVDFNTADVDDGDLDRYLHMRAGALYESLGLVTTGQSGPQDKAAGVLSAVADLLREARDPAYAAVPTAGLANLAAIDGRKAVAEDIDLAVEAVLCVRREQALAAMGPRLTSSVTGSILVSLYKADWARIIATPRGSAPRPAARWSRLWTAWQSARRHHKTGTTT